MHSDVSRLLGDLAAGPRGRPLLDGPLHGSRAERPRGFSAGAGPGLSGAAPPGRQLAANTGDGPVQYPSAGLRLTRPTSPPERGLLCAVADGPPPQALLGVGFSCHEWANLAHRPPCISPSPPRAADVLT